jgi:segregation and condensation protein A
MNENLKADNEQNNQKESGNYILDIQNFKGPLDLLWELIRKAKIDVTEIYVAQITEQYIQYLKLMEEMDFKIASEFIITASELLYYKSKILLPSEEIGDEYFIPPFSPNLIEKLIEYKKMQLTSFKLKELYEHSDNFYTRTNPELVSEEEVYIDVNLFDLLKAFTTALNKKSEVIQKEIIFDEILVSDRIEYIIKTLKDKSRVLFHDLFQFPYNRAEIIATFLAILELAKRRNIKIIQYNVFGEIAIIANSLSKLMSGNLE